MAKKLFGRGFPSRPWLPLRRAPGLTHRSRRHSRHPHQQFHQSLGPRCANGRRSCAKDFAGVRGVWRPLLRRGGGRSRSPSTNSRRSTAPLQSCQLERGGPVFVNMVGIHGVALAGYWWGRLGSRLLRLLLRIFGKKLLLWILLFADDWLTLSGGTV